MKIKWKPNPCHSHIVLETELDRQIWRHCLEQDAYIDHIFSKWWELGKSVKAACFLGDIKIPEESDPSLSQESVDRMTSFLSMGHYGDCTCFPASCGQCQAEEILGISTISEFSKHELHSIVSAFSSGLSIDEVIEKLSQPMSRVKSDAWKGTSDEDYAKLCDRWDKERASASQKMIAYKERHGF